MPSAFGLTFAHEGETFAHEGETFAHEGETFAHEGETIEASDARTNLGSGHGRVRRVALRMSDGRQVNLLAWPGLAVGTLSVSELYAVLRGRGAEPSSEIDALGK